jgi:hypothetical protein
MARRSIVDQVVGNVKTEASKRQFPSIRSLPKICWPGIEPPSTVGLRTTSFLRMLRGLARSVGSSPSACRR